MNIVLLNNHSVLNAGDHAILLQTLALLGEAFPGAHVTLVFNDTASARATLPEHHIIASPLSLAAPLQPDGSYALLPRRSRAILLGSLLAAAATYRLAGRVVPLPRRQGELIAALAGADLVLACGGGYIYAASVEESLGWFTFMALGMLLALLIGKPLVLLPQSIGPLHGRRQHLAARLIARGARLTLVRERISLTSLHTLHAGARALCAPDLAFGHKNAPLADARALLDRYGLNALAAQQVVGVTAINWAGQNHTFGAQTRYEQALVAAIDTLTSRGAAVVLFPQCCGPSAAEDDRLVARRLHAAARHPERIVLVDEPLPPALLQAAYGCMDCFVGTRMHSVILATNAGVPALAIGYLYKTAGVLAELGLQHATLDIATLTADQLVERLDTLRDQAPPPAVHAYLDHSARVRSALPALLQSVAQRGPHR